MIRNSMQRYWMKWPRSMPFSPDDLAEHFLTDALKRSDRAVAHGSDPKALFPAKSSPLKAVLAKLRTRTEQKQFFTALRLAERDGAIQLEWNDLSAADLKCVSVTTFDRLAGYLNVERYGTTVEKARSILSGLGHAPRVKLLLDSWATMAPTGRLKPENANDVRDAWSVIEAASRLDDDIPQRRLSCRVFDDSKRIESLSSAIRWLANEGDETDIDEIFANLGIVRFPQPLLIAGPGVVITTEGQQLSTRPYLGFHPASVESIESPGRYLLTVENQTTFNEFAMGHGGPLEGTVVFVNGQPGTRLAVALKRLYSCGTPLYHWGDQDLGGFYILDRLNRLANEVGASVTPWMMNLPAKNGRKLLSANELDRINRICDEQGWEQCRLRPGSFAVEQEALDLRQPYSKKGQPKPMEGNPLDT